MSNTFGKVSAKDLLSFKDSLGTFIHFYVVNSEHITELAEFFGETEDETVITILSIGLRGYRERMELLSDAKRGDEL